jgi:Flp pilus assembly protein TadD
VDAQQWKAAYELLAPLIEVAPEDAEANYLLAFVLHRLGHNDSSAVRHYERALAAGFSEFWVRYNLGALQLARGECDAARANLERATALDPDHSGPRQILAQLS